MNISKTVAFGCLVILSALPLRAQWEVGGLIGVNAASTA